ncbi:olfactory receptor 10A4-like [Varanus komodoensis]|uniref:olfactory receptor 10A4-like n=1 Tax=Varanus komodoensis TaxID=61221 RepID=UPI001CF7763A|nr:olfactory receptor 10A4-like [Varanus komodoensis]
MAFIFLTFLVINILTIAWNLLIIILILTDPCLHTPMYFFLGNLSCLETCYTSIVIPPMLLGLLKERKHLSLLGCLVQAYFFGSFAAAECFLLVAMAYDGYLAICCPLHYGAVMDHILCTQLSTASWIMSFLLVGFGFCLILRRHFCGPWELENFFCDSIMLLKLTCPVSDQTELVFLILAAMATLIPFLLTVASYIVIVSTIIRIPSSTKRQKAFSTCSSHLTVVTMFYGTLIMVPPTEMFAKVQKYLSLLYTVVTPMFNPVIYSLRKGEFQGAWRRTFRRIVILK